MNCLKFRQLKLAEPNATDPLANQHRDQCRKCYQFEQELVMLDIDLHQAFSITPPEGLEARILLNQSLQPTRIRPRRLLWLGIAASFILTIFISTSYVNTERAKENTTGVAVASNALAPQETGRIDANPIPESVLEHINHQPHEFYGADHLPIAPERIEAILASFDTSSRIENVVYASICPLGDETAAHLIVKDGEHQYTVMLIPDHSMAQVYTINNDLWRGYISPHPAGTLAVLADAKQRNAITHLSLINEKFHTDLYVSAIPSIH